MSSRMESHDLDKIKSADEQPAYERIFESALWSSRLIVLLAVIFGTISSMLLFIAGSIEIVSAVLHSISLARFEIDYTGLLSGIIGGVDLYLIGMVLLIFSFGVYELAISKIDIARSSESYSTLLEIANLDDLKNKIIKVIIMVLIVSFFQRVLTMKFTGATDMLFMALSISAVCIGVYFLQKLKV
ncbi:MAG: YqhA family protein [Methanomicrobiales archaeon]|nr:YqhA family protein [Methanomicrobiales archaeon]